MRIRPCAAWMALVFAAASAPATIRATVIVPMDLNELVVASDAVVYARVTAVQVIEREDRRRVESLIVTEAIGYMKGDLGRTVAFRVPGGTVGAYKTIVIGAPSFEVGDEVVLFLATRPSDPPRLVGFSQGVYRVQVDGTTGTRMVLPPPLIATGETRVVTRGTRAPMSLETFAGQVRALAAAHRDAR